jgi:hypothetical protein
VEREDQRNSLLIEWVFELQLGLWRGVFVIVCADGTGSRDFGLMMVPAYLGFSESAVSPPIAAHQVTLPRDDQDITTPRINIMFIRCHFCICSISTILIFVSAFRLCCTCDPSQHHIAPLHQTFFRVKRRYPALKTQTAIRIHQVSRTCVK